MSIELKIPEVGESVREVQIGRWLKKEGDTVKQDEDLVELESDKASMELPAPAAGVLAKIVKQQGDVVGIGDVIGHLEKQDDADAEEKGVAHDEDDDGKPAADAKKEKSERPHREESDVTRDDEDGKRPEKEASRDVVATPSARRELRKHDLNIDDLDVDGTRIDLEDVRERLASKQVSDETPHADSELEEVVPMSLIRRRIAQRLVEAQQQTALVTTFNEVDMSAVQETREAYKEQFRQEYGIKLGIMSFFVKAVVDALKEQPGLNAQIRDDNIVYRHYHHIGIAIGSERGLVVPVLRYAERMSFAEIERAIDDFADRADTGKLQPDELAGGTFTITNGGIFGSLLSTPLINPPQSGVLGMHAIQQRPVARDGQVVIRPMMYLALTYDHRLIDGREAVLFLKRIQEAIEDPARMLLEV